MRNIILISLIVCASFSCVQLQAQTFGQSPTERTWNTRGMDFALSPYTGVRYKSYGDEPGFVDFGVGAYLMLDYSMEADNTLNSGNVVFFGIGQHFGGYASNRESVKDVSLSTTRLQFGYGYTYQGLGSGIGWHALLDLGIDLVTATAEVEQYEGGFETETASGGAELGGGGLIGINKLFDLGAIDMILYGNVGFLYMAGKPITFTNYSPEGGGFVPELSVIAEFRF